MIAMVASTLAFDSRDLFTIKGSPRAKSVEERSSIASVREAEIVIGRQVLAENSKIRFTLFDSKTFTANRLASEGLEVRGNENVTWRGKLADKKFNGGLSSCVVRVFPWGGSHHESATSIACIKTTGSGSV